MNTLVDFEMNSEFITMRHMSDNRTVLKAIKEEREQNNNGWSQDRTMQKIGVIPALEYVRLCKINPELRDPNKLEKWLMSWEGAGYRVAEDSPHRCANIIIK